MIPYQTFYLIPYVTIFSPSVALNVMELIKYAFILLIHLFYKWWKRIQRTSILNCMKQFLQRDPQQCISSLSSTLVNHLHRSILWKITWNVSCLLWVGWQWAPPTGSLPLSNHNCTKFKLPNPYTTAAGFSFFF